MVGRGGPVEVTQGGRQDTIDSYQSELPYPDYASPMNQPTEVDPEDLRMYNDEAVMLAYDLAPGESSRWADLVNTAASMGEIHNEQADERP